MSPVPARPVLLSGKEMPKLTPDELDYAFAEVEPSQRGLGNLIR